MSLTKVSYSLISGAPVNVQDYGAVGNGVTDDTTAIQTAINALQNGQSLYFPNGTYVTNTGFTITNKSNIRITGKSTIALTSASSSAYIFQLVGTIDNLEIDGLTFVGDALTVGNQTGIGCASGQTISNTRFHDLNISNLNVGISHNANLSGSWDKGLCYNNSLKNITGTASGSGYGIHIAKATNIRVYDNVIDNASRHSIYQASGVNVNNIIHNNLIVNHRSTVADNSYRFAIVCSRSSDVTISNNKFLNCYDGQVEVSHDTADAQDCDNVLVIGNTFTNRKNIVPSIIIGEQLIPTTKETAKITIQNNVFDCSYTDVLTSNDILLLNGNNVYIEDNKFRRWNVAGTNPTYNFVTIGYDTYLSSDSQIYNIFTRNNICTADVLSTNSYFAYVSQRLCSGSSLYLVKNNTLSKITGETFFPITPTNVNSKLKFTFTKTVDLPSITANTTQYFAYSYAGIKPTSCVTGAFQYSVSVNPPPAYTFGAKDDAVNTYFISATNATTGASDQPSQTFTIFVEDF